MSYLFTSESVSEGHPDKVCDRISDTVLDLFLSYDSNSRVACETLATSNRVVLAGEVRANDDKLLTIKSKIEEKVRNSVKHIGYQQDKFHYNTFTLDNYLHEQSADIAQGVDSEGAGDQGLMFGYACNETEELMPAPIKYSHDILKSLSKIRKDESDSILGPDSKSQVTLSYNDNGVPEKLEKLVVSTQHVKGASENDIRKLITPIIEQIFPSGWMVQPKDFLINPTGNFEIGGPDGDAGLTGRKIIVDTYGGAAPHGGGAFSGKDPTKVDRSAAYAARYLAKNIVASKLADKCTIQLAYAIGVANPLSIYVDTHNTSKISNKTFENFFSEEQIIDLTPTGIINFFDLKKPIYSPTSSYGHFGRRPNEAGPGTFSWEKTDLSKNITKLLT